MEEALCMCMITLLSPCHRLCSFTQGAAWQLSESEAIHSTVLSVPLNYYCAARVFSCQLPKLNL